ncbi:MAG: adenine phosphoribosyltransferase [Acidobacteria bacterium]|nr:adenine phosphoribosyltransferase [Acidobacteriota bacterium]
MEELKKKIREVPDFPKPGILFYDVTTLLKDKDGLRQIIEILTRRYQSSGITKVLGIESRGFILGPPLAYNIGAGFVPVRKPGKLPAQTFRLSYDLEYGTDALEIHTDAIDPGERVLIVDDLIATGGTAAAAAMMATRMEADIVELAFLIELDFLQGRSKLDGYNVFSILRY